MDWGEDRGPGLLGGDQRRRADRRQQRRRWEGRGPRSCPSLRAVEAIEEQIEPERPEDVILQTKIVSPQE